MIVPNGRITVGNDKSGEGETLPFDTNRGFTVRREWIVRVFVLRDAKDPEARGQFTFLSSPSLPEKGESIEVSGRRYEVAYRKFSFCSSEGATKIAVDLYVIGHESFGGGEPQ